MSGVQIGEDNIILVYGFTPYYNIDLNFPKWSRNFGEIKNFEFPKFLDYIQEFLNWVLNFDINFMCLILILKIINCIYKLNNFYRSRISTKIKRKIR